MLLSFARIMIKADDKVQGETDEEWKMRIKMLYLFRKSTAKTYNWYF